MSVAILGAGSIGSVIGGLLALNGEEVVFICRKAHADAINKRGLLIKGEKTFRAEVKASTDPKEMQGKNWVFLCTKTYDTEESSQLLKKYCTGNIVSLQNGVRNHEIIQRITKRKCFCGIVSFNGRYDKPGEVTLVYKGDIVIGDPFSKREKELLELQSLLRKIFPTRIERNIVSCLWGKLLFNLINPVSAITGFGYFEGLQNQAFRMCSKIVIEEGREILNRAGIKFKYCSPSMHIFTWLLYAPSSLIRFLLRLKKWDIQPSTLQDLRTGKKTEVPYINGEIVKLSIKTGVSGKLNSKLLGFCLNFKGFITPEELYKKLLKVSEE